jgi:hypothetical protein
MRGGHVDFPPSCAVASSEVRSRPGAASLRLRLDRTGRLALLLPLFSGGSHHYAKVVDHLSSLLLLLLLLLPFQRALFPPPHSSPPL